MKIMRAACMASIIAILSSAVVAIVPLQWLDTCATDSRGRQYTEVDMYNFDKRAQRQYFSLMYATLSCTIFFATACWKRPRRRDVGGRFGLLLLWFMDAILAHIYRLLHYSFIILPLGFWLENPNCGTNKSISGHTHMFIYHNLYVMLVLFLDPPTPSIAVTGNTWSEILSIAFFCATAVFSVYALDMTYSYGYHSPRHMLYGAAAGVLSWASYAIARRTVLDCIAMTGPNTERGKIK